MFDRDFDVYVHGFGFTDLGVMKYAVFLTLSKNPDWQFKLSELINNPTGQCTKNYRVVENIVEYELQYYETLWSKWRGTINEYGSGIIFTVENADYDDINGLYEFVSYDTDIVKPKPNWVS